MLYPIGIQDFEKIRKEGYVYVDKTDLVYRLAKSGVYYFLSRPRRFGKSLLVSTMEAYFSGRKDLFEGLAVAELEKDWTEYPVLRFDLSGKSYAAEEDLMQQLDLQLSAIENRFGIEKRYDSPDVRFQYIIESVYGKTGRRVVILIDEYDKPIVDNLGDDGLSETLRRRLQGFYSVMKAKDGFIQFGFLTGVSKLGRLSVFSGLNNLEDVSMDARYADICGISEQDLRKYFGESVVELARANGLSEEECYARIAEMYDGYHFHPRSEGVYNPFSVLNAFKSLMFRKYWFSTGTPSFLVRYLEQGNYRLDNLAACRASEQDLSGVNARRPQVITLLYQTGYLTIKDYNPRTDR
ncbi:MAG: AAA family ATPase, partial [Bacteroidales bacterium]|nr:AAA family ATPase [Bacteroidales bacterium]